MSTPGEYFAGMYAGTTDPWSLQTRWYEQRKRALTVAALTRPRYRSAFEPGCSVGALTEQLAGRCDRLLATDREPAAVRTAQARLAWSGGVRVEVGTVPHEWPPGIAFDLVVLSEVGYYLDEAALAVLVDAAAGALEPGGELVAVHWRHHVDDHALPGDRVHQALRGERRLFRVAGHEEVDFLLDVFRRVEPGEARPPSVAACEGLL